MKKQLFEKHDQKVTIILKRLSMQNEKETIVNLNIYIKKTYKKKH